MSEKVRIVDDIMGSGKSTWALNYVNEHREQRFLCVVPTLDECKRYEESLDINIVEPKAWGDSKWNNFKNLLRNRRNIVTTHALVSKMDLPTLELIRGQNYTLIIDECLDVLRPYELKKDDINMLFNDNLIDVGEDGYIIWNNEADYRQGMFTPVKNACEMRSLMGYRNPKTGKIQRIIMWNFPSEFFGCFEESYVMTYLWSGSIQKTYFDLHHVQYEKFMLDDEKNLIPHDPKIEQERIRKVASLIHLYHGALNKVGEKIGTSQPLSKTWYTRHANDGMIDKIRKNAENYFRSSARTPASDNMWSTFDIYKKQASGRAYAKGFVSCNARATNIHREKKSLAYLINFYIHPDVQHFLDYYKIDFNSDQYSLTVLLQWIWRSQIRDGKPINLYIPSERMRNLLEDWMNGSFSTENKINLRRAS